MTNSNELKPFEKYAAASEEFRIPLEQYEANQNYQRGFEPLESLPATWYNSILYALTSQANETYRLVSNIYTELANAIGTLDPSSTTQLKQAIAEASAPIAATSAALGSIKLGFEETVTDSKRAVMLNAENRAYVDCKKAGSGQAGLVVSNSENWGVQYDAQNSGKGTVKTVDAATNAKGIVRLNNTLTSTSTTEALTAAQGKSLKDSLSALKVSLKIEDGVLYINLGATIPTGYATSVTLPSTTSVEMATYAKYLVNSDEPSGTNYVTADASRNLKAYTLELS